MQGETRDMFYKVSLVLNEKKRGGFTDEWNWETLDQTKLNRLLSCRSSWSL